MQKRFIAFVMVVVLCLGLLAGCKGDTTTDGVVGSGNGKDVNGDSEKEQVFSFSTLDEPTGLNPVVNATEPDYAVQRLILEGLVNYVSNEEGIATIQPGAAED